MKVTNESAQTVDPGFAEMVTDGATVGFTVMTICAASATAGEAQGSFEINWQSTVSPLARVLLV